jgi:hypothetical protein
MYKYLTAALLLMCFHQSFAQSKVNKGFKKYMIYANKTLEFKNKDSMHFSAQMVDGKDWVFVYHYQADEYADMTDDEFTEMIYFVVPSGAANFELTGASLRAAYLRSCFCMERGWHKISDGVIKGTKNTDGTWNVGISINTPREPDRSANPLAIDVSGKFSLADTRPAKSKKVKRKKRA